MKYLLKSTDGRIGGYVHANSLEEAIELADVLEVPEWFDWDGAYVGIAD